MLPIIPRALTHPYPRLLTLVGKSSATYTKKIDQKQHNTSLLIISTIVSRIKKVVESLIEVKTAKTKHMIEDIPNPSNENGFLLILLIII